MPCLSDPIQIGRCALQHRIVMAPMTRLRADEDHVPLDMVIEYYAQRASTPGTLLITEATFISFSSCGRDANAPGIFTQPQIDQWKAVCEAVHSRGSFIFLQMWHVGRAAREHALKAKELEMVSSSAVPISSDHATPRPMTEQEIWQCISDFAQAAKNALTAGFDGVEIHAANGYLIDQFTQDTCNQRTDAWGGSVEKRSKFCFEVAKAVADAVGPNRTGVRLSPFSPFQGMCMEDPKPQFTDLIRRLRRLNLAYLHLVEPRVAGNVDRDAEKVESLDFALEAWDKANPVLLAGGFTPESAKKAVESDHRDQDVAIVFGRRFISNPDLAWRVLDGRELSAYNRETFYKSKSRDGYIDYPFLDR